MAVLTQEKIDKDVKDLLDYLEGSQWNFVPNFMSISSLKIMTRDDLRRVEMKDDIGSNKTSGSSSTISTIS